MAAGRTTTYTLEIAERICKDIATSNKGIVEICNNCDDYPCHQTVSEWRIRNKEFGAMYARAKQDQVEFLVDEILTICDDTSKDKILNDKGILVTDHEHVNRSRLRIDTRKWIAAKLAPRLYGDKTVIEQTTVHKLDESNIAELETAKKAYEKPE